MIFLDLIYSVPLRNSVLSISANDLTESTRCNLRPLSLTGSELQDATIYQRYEYSNNTLQRESNEGNIFILKFCLSKHNYILNFFRRRSIIYIINC